MTITRNKINPQELCSRKLWELVSTTSHKSHISESELLEAIAELAERRHYLAELEEIGKLEK
jgi:hypothetical protein